MLINLLTSIEFLSLVFSSFFIKLLYSAWSRSFYRASYSSSSNSVVWVLVAYFTALCINRTLCLFSLLKPYIIYWSSSISCASSTAHGMSDIFDLWCATFAYSYYLYLRRLYNSPDITSSTTWFWGSVDPQQPWDLSSLIAASLGFS